MTKKVPEKKDDILEPADLIIKEMNNQKGFEPVLLTQLPYEMDGLEPVISKQLMELHHGELHFNYVRNLNALYTKANKAIEKGNTDEYIELYEDLKFNEGGHYNHEFFWKSLAPIEDGGGDKPEKCILGQPLTQAIEDSFGGNVHDLIYQFQSEAEAFKGKVGWVWLVLNTFTKKLEIRKTVKQNRIIEDHLVPLLTIDISEHAYEMDYKNEREGDAERNFNRQKYMQEIWKIVNWRKVIHRFNTAGAMGSSKNS